MLVAESEDHAALLGIDRALRGQRWIYRDDLLDDRTRREHLMLEALLQLDPDIRVSQRGFGRRDAKRVGTPETVTRWHDLMTEVYRFGRVAVFSRNAVRATIGADAHETPIRRRPR